MKKTFAYENQLPSLPIPSLQSTKTKLREWIKPLVTKEQFQKTNEVIDQFFEENGKAEKLQEKLQEWDDRRDGSWLAPLWDDSYLKERNSLPLTSNFNVLLKNEPYGDRYSVTELAGKISFLVTELYHQIIFEKIEPSMFRDKPLDMGQYRKFFRSVRIPQLVRDGFHVADFEKENNHVVLLYKNNVYKVPVTNDQGVMYQSSHITAAIEAVISDEQNEGTNVGLFTAAERDVATKIYEKLTHSKVNTEILQMIADSLVVISIDEESKTSEEAIKNLMLHPSNKYYDKTIQIIITQYGEIGFNIEHSAVDGTSIATVISHVSKGLAQDLPHTDYPPQKPIVEKQTWELTKEIQGLLGQIQKEHVQRSKDYFLHSKIFTDFGAESIKKMKISPDAFFHIALQLAMYRTYGQLKSVYEPVSVRVFKEGRTECARATSMEKRALVEAIESGHERSGTLYSLMQTASIAHRDRIKGCQQGLGVERHLFGLEQMYHLYGSELGLGNLPEIFQDEGYQTLRHDFLSTSGMPYENAKYRMFSPVVNNGHGVAYFLLEDSITMNISSFSRNQEKGKQLKEHMVDALHELRMIAEDQVNE